MFDVFTEEIEIIIKDGIANLYWYKGDLQKACARSGVPQEVIFKVANSKNSDGTPASKRKQMDVLYEELRKSNFNKRLEVSRNFVRILIEHKNFAPQDNKHKIDIAEKSALRLKEELRKQEDDLRKGKTHIERKEKTKAELYNDAIRKIKDEFNNHINLSPSKRGYSLEKIFIDLMKASEIEVIEPFKIKGEQIDGAIKHEGSYYLIELKWWQDKVDPKEIAHFYYKVEGKMNARGLFISMSGYTDGVIDGLVHGKSLKVMLLDGMHLSRVINSQYTFNALLAFAISEASLKGNLYCSHQIKDMS